ncbi:RES family NAD+ phosphorylase [Pseudomonas antarctica]|uniref:RES family NAD+ phosphorylase n=1 Tax=Pseudomonas antarctica TaxID=219572 RepID=UPI00387A94E5
MARCCTDCFTDTSLKEKIHNHGTMGRCGFCGSSQVICIDPAELKNKMELLTYGLSENEEGHTFSEIVVDIYCVISKKTRDPSYLLDAIFTEPGMGNKKYTFDFEHKTHTQKWEEFKVELKHQNRFFPKNAIYSSVFKSPPDELDGEVFFQLLEQLKTPTYENEEFYRARISDVELAQHQMSCPPKLLVSGGRANPAGIPYLYLAQNIDTCINEVRPSNSSCIYVSKFTPTKELSILDLTAPRSMCSVTSFEEHQLPSVLNLLNLLELFSIDLSKPVLPENSNLDYVPTQFLCEFIKSEANFDGLSFKSSFNSGTNLVVFDASMLLASAPKKYVVTHTQHTFNARE